VGQAGREEHGEELGLVPGDELVDRGARLVQLAERDPDASNGQPAAQLIGGADGQQRLLGLLEAAQLLERQPAAQDGLWVGGIVRLFELGEGCLGVRLQERVAPLQVTVDRRLFPASGRGSACRERQKDHEDAARRPAEPAAGENHGAPYSVQGRRLPTSPRKVCNQNGPVAQLVLSSLRSGRKLSRHTRTTSPIRSWYGPCVASLRGHRRRTQPSWKTNSSSSEDYRCFCSIA